METGSFWQGFLAELKSGEPAMILIAVCLAIGLAFIFERIVRLYLTYAVNGPAFMFEIQKYILANDLDGAIRLCNGAERAALPRIIKAGLQRASREESQIQNAIDAASLETIPKLEKRLPYLALIANISTLFGLLGTITGLIRSFGAIGMADASQRQALLGQGISSAMNATAFGLITAIITMIAHSILTSKANQVIADIDEFGVKLMDLLAARKYRPQSKHSGQHERED